MPSDVVIINHAHDENEPCSPECRTPSGESVVTILDERAVSEIEAGARLDQCLKVVSSAVTNCFCRRPAGHLGSHSESVPPDDVFWIHPAIPTLCATVKHLRTELATTQGHWADTSEDLASSLLKRDDLQSELEQLRAENEELRKLTARGEKSDVFSEEYAAMGHDEKDTCTYD